MEHHSMHPLQPTHRPQRASFDILQSPLYANFPDVLGGDARATQPPHPPPPYAQQLFVPDKVSPRALEPQRSPPRPLSLHELPQPASHPHPGNPPPSPALQQPQPRPPAAYPIFPQDHEGNNQPAQSFPPQLSRPLQQPVHMHFDQWVFDPFIENASPHPTALRGEIPRICDLTYTLHPHSQPRYHLPTTHPSTSTHPSPELPRTVAEPDQATSHERHEDDPFTDHGQRARSWGGAGSLDPITGVFSRAADHPRIRTAQACEKCRARKAKCSGEHPTCQRCLARELPCVYATERRMRGPNKPKPPPPLLPDGYQPAAADGQKTRKRASTMPSVPRRGPQAWGQQQKPQKQRQGQQQEPGVATSASPASSAGSGSFGYPPLSESEASPMTPHSSLENRQPSGVGFPRSPGALVPEFLTTTRPGLLSRVNGGNSYEDDGAVITEGLVAGVYGQPDIFPDVRMPFKGSKPHF
ncbi:hypothetical protein F5148DRAFT_512415 [Russula earlei]|uniref:Uncharacterized protein n=1 Tax=Russula earlei TaxID=71964 RepID=A0ACC0TXC5_9AGAM|nr:hypothetical protein F5148DRAFT_512415 [Russula earlei]